MIRLTSPNEPVVDTNPQGYLYRLIEAGKLKAPFIVTSNENTGIFFVYNIHKGINSYTGDFVCLTPDTTTISNAAKELTLGPYAMWKLYDNPITIQNEAL